MTSQGPQYDINEICRIARSGNLLLERSATRDSRNLNYFDEDIMKCLCNLTENNYHKTIPYELKNNNHKKLFFDVYKIKCCNSLGFEDYLYIKLRITGNNWLFIGSFKQK